jgi:methionyl-tRNA formyltransferase
MNFAERTATELWNRWRGFQPWPGAFTTFEGKKLIAHRMRVAEKSGRAEAGAIEVQDGHLFVACAQETWIEISELQLEGKKRMAVVEFLNGTAVAAGARLG